MEERDPPGAGPGREPDRVLGRGVPEGRLRGYLFSGQLSVVNEQVRVAGELDRGLMVGAEPVRPGPEAGGAVVGDVSEDRPAVAHPVTEGPAALVRDLPGLDGEPFRLVRSRRDRAELPAAPQLAGPDREERRRHHLAEQ